VLFRSGIVKDTDGKPLIGVNVVLTGANSGSPAKTDKYGKFSIEVPSNINIKIGIRINYTFIFN
jgi:hypothetical protein